MRPNETDEFKLLNRVSGGRLTVTPSGCWVKPSCDLNYYSTVTIDGKKIGLHVISALLFHGVKIENKNWSLHKCNVPGCCNPEHLYVGNASDNANDRNYKRENCVVPGCIMIREESPKPSSKMVLQF